jgi:outer membrane protein assembly factor BamD
MAKNPRISLILYVMLMLIATSCGKFRKIQKSNDWELKYRAAMEYYQNKDYYKASVLFEEILPILKGRPEAELAQFDFAYSYYYQKQYVLSAHYFQTFYQLYTRSQYAEEALFMYAYSLYLDSPDFDLDQQSTEDAIQAAQNFLNKFPRSKYKDQATALIDEMREKLEHKAYENAYLYYRLEKYLDGEALKAAIIAFDNFQTDFPDSKYNENVSFLKIECAYRMAKKSIRSKQEERLHEAITYYYYFIDKFPQSARIRDAESLFDDIQGNLAKIKANNM